MDQIKIGKFIASCRKEQDMTQVALSEKLGISDRAVSKWETGKSMPDSGIMLELCSYLKINVNELLSGERLTMENYKDNAEENLMEQRRQTERIKHDTKISYIIMGIAITLITIAHFAINYYFPENKGTGMGLVLTLITIGLYVWYFIRNYEVKRK